MTREHWAFRRSSELEAALDDLEPVLKHKVLKDIEKVETRGINGVSEPLVKKLEGDIYYVRSMVKGCGWFRTFYFRDGRFSFFGFYGYFKKRGRLPGRIVKEIIRKYEEHRGGRA